MSTPLEATGPVVLSVLATTTTAIILSWPEYSPSVVHYVIEGRAPAVTAWEVLTSMPRGPGLSHGHYTFAEHALSPGEERCYRYKVVTTGSTLISRDVCATAG